MAGQDPGDIVHRHGALLALWILESPVRWLLIALIRLYRLTVSPLLGQVCRYHPSCSAFGLEAVQKLGAVVGVPLIVWRILRCNRWSKGGLDPVPPRGRWHPVILPDGSPRPGGRGAAPDPSIDRSHT
jgi:hypothetical protein